MLAYATRKGKLEMANSAVKYTTALSPKTVFEALTPKDFFTMGTQFLLNQILNSGLVLFPYQVVYRDASYKVDSPRFWGDVEYYAGSSRSIEDLNESMTDQRDNMIGLASLPDS